MNNPEDKRLRLDLSMMKDFILRINELRDRISPEKEYVFGAIATYLYLVMLVNPESLPMSIQPTLELLDSLPMSGLSLKLATLTAFSGSVDGARRIVLERLPFYKAYLQVFLLNKIE